MAQSPTLIRQLSGLTRLPGHRQFGLVVGLAVVVALGVTVVLWATTPGYQLLLPDMSERDIAEAVDVLNRNDIEYRLDKRGSLTVPENLVHEARLRLATQGLPRSPGVGFELLDQNNGLGTSQLLENARYQRAVEGELARSIMTLESVDQARVHLALPRPSVFVRDRVKPTASVLITLRAGRQLDDNQVAGIVHMVASSVPELEASRVTVVDQRGRLLSQPSGGVAADASRQLDYTRRLEDAYRQRVEDILAPVVGVDAVRVQVAAQVDFTEVESTHETYDPDKPAIRSEQTSNQQSSSPPTGGVPGALTNQPPGGAVVATAPADGATDTGQAAATPTNRSSSSTRNYELDRTIDHVRQPPATLHRLSVAVVVDDRDVVDADGTHSHKPRDAEEMQRLTALVREAVGFDEQRGDSVNVVNQSFREIEEPPPPPPPPIWTQPWVKQLARYGAAAFGLLLLIFVVLRPALKSLAQVPAPRTPVPLPDGAATPAMLAPQGIPGSGSVTEQQLNRARQIANDDPRLAAQVVRRWIGDDGK
jgi:flagellar M-ring protein FliF